MKQKTQKREEVLYTGMLSAATIAMDKLTPRENLAKFWRTIKTILKCPEVTWCKVNFKIL